MNEEVKKDIDDFNNKKVTLTRLAEKYGLHIVTLSVRKNERMPFEDALVHPLGKRYKKSNSFIGHTTKDYKTLKI